MNIYSKLILKCTPIARDLCDDRGLCRLSTFLSSTLSHFLICFLLNYPHLTCSLKAIYSHGIPHLFSLQVCYVQEGPSLTLFGQPDHKDRRRVCLVFGLACPDAYRKCPSRHFDLSAPAMPIFTLSHTHTLTHTRPDMGKQTAMTNPQNPPTMKSLVGLALGSSC